MTTATDVDEDADAYPVGKWWPCLVAARQAHLTQRLSERARLAGDLEGHQWLDRVARYRLRVTVSRLEDVVSRG